MKLLAALVLIGIAWPTSAAAEGAGEAKPPDPNTPNPSEAPRKQPRDKIAAQSDEEAGRDIREQAHTTFELGVGLLALPAAEVCPTQDSCEPGEMGIAFSFQNLYHFDPFALGAGIVWGFGLRQDSAAGDEDGSLGREHSRGYFLVEGQFRYNLARVGSWDFWANATVGGVVIKDSWDTLADREPYADTDFVGPRAQTMSTEGFVGGIGLGAQWNFTERGIFGSHFRYANWFLPTERDLSPTGDPVSLAGRIDVFDLGLMVAYRLNI